MQPEFDDIHPLKVRSTMRLKSPVEGFSELYHVY